MTPHYDLSVGAACHAVPEDWYGDADGPAQVSGFVVARNRVVEDWLESGHHTVVETQVWDNIDELVQGCGTGWRPQSDGRVIFLGLTPD